MSEHIKGPPAAAMQDELPQFWQESSAASERARQDRELERTAKGLEDFRRAEEAKLERQKLKLTGSSSAPVRRANPDDIVLEIAMSSDDTVNISYLVDPWLPDGQVVGFYGRGETAKSSFVATLAAGISDRASTLWISTEEPVDWIKVRHIKAGGENASLFAFKAVVTKTDTRGHATASSFNVYEHLEAAILKGKEATLGAASALEIHERPLRLVVLDTAVALTTWERSESPNDDASVKRLLAFLLGLCEKHAVTIAVIGHSNKGKHDNLMDTVAGSAAWVNSPRQAFTHIRDQRAEYSFVSCTVKSTLTGTFAAEYTTHPIHTLATRPDGKDSVLCAVRTSPIEWGFESAMELVNAATGKDEEPGADQPSAKESAIAKIVAVVLRLLGLSTMVDRSAVETELGFLPHRRNWQEADQMLCTDHNLLIRRGERGKIFYQRK